MLPDHIAFPLTFTIHINCPLVPDSKPDAACVLASEAVTAHLEFMGRTTMTPEEMVVNVRTLADLCIEMRRVLQIATDNANSVAN